MAFLSEENQREIKTIFEQLDHEVHLEFFTERESPIIIPGGNCPTCKDTRLLLQEVVALSDKLHLDVHEVTTQTVINESVRFVGNVPEAVFRQHLERAVSAG